MIYLIAIIFPWLAFMLKGNIGIGILCLILQITVIGWLPATIWAIVYINNQNAEKRNQEVIKTMEKSNLYNKPKNSLTLEEKARLFDERNGNF